MLLTTAGAGTRKRGLAGLCAALGLLALACGGNSTPAAVDPTVAPSGRERPFLMGISAQPPVPSEFSFRDTFALAQEAGEVVLIQRNVPWSDFVPGGTVSSRTEQLTHLEKELAERHGMRLLLAVDPTSSGNRGELSGLPERMADAEFDDPDVRSAFVAYAKYLALNYEPAYLALGVEVDLVYAALGDAAFRNFLSLYFEAYDAVKEVSPETLVFPTFQYEDMLGILDSGSSQLPSWNLVDRFDPKIDMLAVSSYPGLVFDGISEVPQDYYQGLQDRINKPLAFVSVGWVSEDSVLGEPGEASQLAFLNRVLAAAEELDARLVIWHLGRDPEVTPAGFEPLAKMGLHDIEGRPKQSWHAWMAMRVRPAPGPP